MKSRVSEIRQYLLNLQTTVCNTLSDIDGKEAFIKDAWTRPDGGDGVSRVLEGGNVFERAGVNFSHVIGDSLPQAASEKNPKLANSQFEALGVSLVIHPQNPYVPTTHANIRFFIATTQTGESIWWFGGGFDLTPYYPFEEDCVHWHTVSKAACDPFGDDLYPRFKKWADDYFYLPHRGETRGIGGLFFDDFNEQGFDHSFAFMKSIGDHFLEAYVPIVEKRKSMTFGDEQRDFQLYRRGRYVEFNLLFDRGTKFGMQFGGRAESILMSLPSTVNWRYNWQPEPGSQEAALYTDFLHPRDYI